MKMRIFVKYSLILLLFLMIWPLAHAYHFSITVINDSITDTIDTELSLRPGLYGWCNTNAINSVNGGVFALQNNDSKVFTLFGNWCAMEIKDPPVHIGQINIVSGSVVLCSLPLVFKNNSSFDPVSAMAHFKAAKGVDCMLEKNAKVDLYEFKNAVVVFIQIR